MPWSDVRRKPDGRGCLNQPRAAAYHPSSPNGGQHPSSRMSLRHSVLWFAAGARNFRLPKTLSRWPPASIAPITGSWSAASDNLRWAFCCASQLPLMNRGRGYWPLSRISCERRAAGNARVLLPASGSSRQALSPDPFDGSLIPHSLVASARDQPADVQPHSAWSSSADESKRCLIACQPGTYRPNST
jgi:hypothetical protein